MERELDADLVVVSREEKTATADWLFPSVTERLLQYAKADVLVVHEQPSHGYSRASAA